MPQPQITVQYDKEIEVTAEQYSRIIIEYAGFVFHRSEAGRYFIKWGSGKRYHEYKNQLEKYLNK
jgi:hypothetical protein